MVATLILKEFYNTKTTSVPPNLCRDLNHFNVFHREEYLGPQAQPVTYS